VDLEIRSTKELA